MTYTPPQPSPARGEGADLTPTPRAYALEQLLDLAYDVSSYLRHQAKPVVRISAALLLAASLAACSAAPAAPTASSLQQEVRTGLPSRAGFYAIAQDSLARDSRGVYHFAWLEPGATGTGTPASASLVRLTRADTNQLQIVDNGDPILHLRQDAPIALASTVSGASTTVYRSGGYPMWYPFPVGGGYFGSGYYDPPARTIPSSGNVSGSSFAAQPRPPAERSFGVSSAVSGQAGGTGSGTVATSKSGADFAPAGGKSSSVAPAKSSGFSSGKSSSSTSSGGSSSSASGG